MPNLILKIKLLLKEVAMPNRILENYKEIQEQVSALTNLFSFGNDEIADKKRQWLNDAIIKHLVHNQKRHENSPYSDVVYDSHLSNGSRLYIARLNGHLILDIQSVGDWLQNIEEHSPAVFARIDDVTLGMAIKHSHDWLVTMEADILNVTF